ncbi:hypothetical protein CG709_06400, partial [Lachnotalea glycerini]
YNEMMKNAIKFQRLGVLICVIIYDIIALNKYINYKKHDKIVYLIHPKVEKIIEVICLICGIMGFGMACFY